MCGDDGETYSSMCQLELSNCVTGGEVEAAHDGECEQESRQCSRTEFRCETSGDCVSYLLVCDGVDNCEDGSDEKQNCDSECSNNQFRSHINILIIDNKSSCLQGVVMESVCPMTRDVTECQTVTLMSLIVLLPVMVTSSSAMMVHVSRQSTGMSSCSRGQ